MLSPEDRLLLTEQLRSPEGFELDHALITTFSLDLTALLTVPLALTFFDWDERENGRPRMDPVSLLDSLRNRAEQLTVLCEPGAIKVPRAQQSLFAFLEPAVRGIRAPQGGAFHPKLWILRFVSSGDDRKAGAIRYRVLCLSRNLTFDRSWDVLVSLDGDVPSKPRAHPPSAGLAAFVGGVLRASDAEHDRLDDRRRDLLRTIADEIEHVRFEPPDGFDRIEFHALGLGPAKLKPIRRKGDRLLVVSPFVSSAKLDELAGEQSILISRQEELDALPVKALEQYGERYVLTDLLEPEPLSDESTASDDGTDAVAEGSLSGLHAKLFVRERNGKTAVLAGSANATTSAFSRNVEFMVELTGSGRSTSIDAILGNDREGLRPLLEEYRRNEDVETDPEQEQADALADAAARALGLIPLELRAPEADGKYRLELSAPEGLPDELAATEVTAKIWPITLSQHRAKPLTEGLKQCRWEKLQVDQIIAFFGCRVSAGSGKATAERDFTLRATLVDAPADRYGEITRSVINSADRLKRYLAFLLADPETDPASAIEVTSLVLSEPGWTNPEVDPVISDDVPLLERLIQAIDRDPQRVDRVASLVEDLLKTPEGRKLLPDGFEEVWGPISEARRVIRSS